MGHQADLLGLASFNNPRTSAWHYIAIKLMRGWNKEIWRVKGHSSIKKSTILHVYLKNVQSLNISRLICYQADFLGLALFDNPRASACHYIATKLVRGWYKEILRVKGHSINKKSSILYVHLTCLTDMQSLSISRVMCHQANSLDLGSFIYPRASVCHYHDYIVTIDTVD